MSAGNYYTAEDLLNLEITEIPMLWKPFIPQTGLIGLTGPSDTGKSTLLRQLAISICLGKEEFLGYPLNVKHGNVVYISTEDGKEAVSVSIKKQLKGVESSELSNLKFIFNDSDQLNTLSSILENESIDLVVIDAWADLFKGNTNDVGDVRRALNRFSKAAEMYGFAIVILHHTVKNSENYNPNKNRLNGSQGIEAKLRALIEVRKGEDNERILSILKGNYISGKEKDKSLVLSFDEDRLIFRTTGKTLDKNSISCREENTFNGDAELLARIITLKQNDGLSFNAVRTRLVEELGEEKTPSLTTIKNMFTRSVGQPNT